MKKTSWLQRFLWSIAGAEVEILEQDDCRTDHKKFTRIGATILVTAVIAFFAGAFAAWYFTQNGDETKGNLFASIVFGLLWSFLIINIDMALVVTLKKDPTRAKQKWVIPFISRALLAVLIAFMVSIPLELFVFRTLINVKQGDYTVAEKGNLTKRFKTTTDEGRLDEKEDQYLEELRRLGKRDSVSTEKIRKLLADSTTWADKKNNPRESPDYNIALNNYNRKVQEWRDNGEEGVKPSYNEVLVAKTAWETSCDSRLNPIKKSLAVERQIRSEIRSDLESNRSNLQGVKDQQTPLAQERIKLENVKDSLLQNGNHFIMNFEILEWAVKPSNNDGKWIDLIFLWMIRLFFFLIEIMPTIVKIVTPVGSYDRKVYAEEQSLITHLASSGYAEAVRRMHESVIKLQEGLLEEQQKADLELKTNLLDYLKDSQLELAKLSIDKWKQEESERLNKTHTPPSTGASTKEADEDNDESYMSMA